MVTTLRRFNRDRRGEITVQAILFIPVLLTIIFSGLTLWQVLSVKRALHLATYEATRYLTFYPVNSRNPADWEQVVIVFIEQEMRHTELRGSLDPAKRVTVAGVESEVICGITTITVTANWVVNINLPFVSPISLALWDQHEGTILCGPG